MIEIIIYYCPITRLHIIIIHMLSRIFSKSKPSAPSTKLSLYLNSDFKQSIEIEDQEVGAYLSSSEEAKEYIFLLIKDKKDNTLLKRKLNLHERFSEVLASVEPLHRGYLVMGYDSVRKNSLKLSILKTGIETESTQAIRSGLLYKFSEADGKFEECSFKLLPNYLVYYRVRNKGTCCATQTTSRSSRWRTRPS